MIHVVNSGLFTVDHSDNIIDKNSSDIKISTLSKTKMSHLVMPNGQVPNSVNYPTIKSYLESEAASGYVLEMMNQTTIITKQVPIKVKDFKAEAIKKIFVISPSLVDLKRGRDLVASKTSFMSTTPFTALLYNDNHVLVAVKADITTSTPSASLTIKNQRLLWNTESDPLVSSELTDYIYWN
jgi:hypothetical protein